MSKLSSLLRIWGLLALRLWRLLAYLWCLLASVLWVWGLLALEWSCLALWCLLTLWCVLSSVWCFVQAYAWRVVELATLMWRLRALLCLC